MKTNPPIIPMLALLALSTLDPQLSTVFAQGSLTPPGPPAPTMLTLNQIEPRTPISSAPYTITQEGSYYLTGNIFVAGNTNAITVLASQVTIDLNGFGLFGESGVNAAIVVPNPQLNITVRNGTLEYWGVGVQATNASNSSLEKLQCFESLQSALTIGQNSFVSDCIVQNAAEGGGGNGIQAGDGSTIMHCTVGNSFNHFSIGMVVGTSCVIESSTVTSNFIGIITGDSAVLKDCGFLGSSSYGVQAGNGCTISDCSACNNGFTTLGLAGISTGEGCTIRGCTADRNSEGINAGLGSTIKECTVISNATTGLIAGNGCTISDCTANDNTNGILAASECTIAGCTASANNGDGIQATYSCLIKGNTCSSNSRYAIVGGAGIHVLDSGNRIEDNLLNSDQYGIKADGNENLIIRNTVRASGSDNYNIASGNMVDTIVNAAASGVVLGPTGGTSLGTTDPWANFSF